LESSNRQSRLHEISAHLLSHFPSAHDMRERLHRAVYVSDESEEDAVPELCFDLSYIYSLITTGYGLRDTQTLYIRKKINGIETGWSLGATIEVMHRLSSREQLCMINQT
jgi:guanosine-diphosphatase